MIFGNLYWRTSLVVVFFSVAIIYFSLHYSFDRIYKAYETKDWKVTNGTIIKSYLNEEIKYKDRKHYRSYSAEIIYSYVVADHKIKNDDISHLFHMESSRTKLSRVIDKYPKGSSVDVYYNPENIEESILERDLKLGDFVILIFGLFATFSFVKFRIYMYLFNWD